MNIKNLFRNLVLDLLAQREDRYYWRQPLTDFELPPDATLCLWQPDGKLGDSVIHTILLDNIARQRPDVRVIVVCAASLVQFWQRIPGVWKSVSAHPARQAASAVLSVANRVDVFVSLEAFASVDTLLFMREVKAPITVGLSVGRFKGFLYSLADNTYDHPRRHVTDRLRNLCSLMRLEYRPTSSVARIAAEQRTSLVTVPEHQESVFLNIYGAGPQKLFSPDTVSWMLEQIRLHVPTASVILNVPEAQRDSMMERMKTDGSFSMSLAPQGMSIWELIALMNQCLAVVTPDTAIGHIAAALDLPVAVFFEDIHYTPVVWRPLCDKLQVVTPVKPGNVNNFDPSQASAALSLALARHDAQRATA